MHRHDFIEFFYVMSGSCSHILNGIENVITAGDAFLIMPNDEHIFLNPSTNTDFMHRDILFSLDYFSQVCDKQKLVYAKSLLATTDLSIEKICVLCGINSTSYFHRIFKKEFKESPNASRNK